MGESDDEFWSKYDKAKAATRAARPAPVSGDILDTDTPEDVVESIRQGLDDDDDHPSRPAPVSGDRTVSLNDAMNMVKRIWPGADVDALRALPSVAPSVTEEQITAIADTLLHKRPENEDDVRDMVRQSSPPLALQ